MTEVNQDPGPSTIQSASSTTSTDSGQAGGSSGASRTAHTSPVVFATRGLAADPWRSRPAFAGPGRSRRPRSPAARRPSAAPDPPRRAAWPTMSSPATGSPSRSHSPAISRLPRAWPLSGPSPSKRYCSTSAQVRPDSSSPHSAARAIRRSPGGRQFSSSRSRPEEPPSSATVTIAVSWSVTRRSADSDAASPWPPPKATTRGSRGPSARRLLRAGAHSRPRSRCSTVVGRPRRPDPVGELLGDGRAAVLAAGAADAMVTNRLPSVT